MNYANLIDHTLLYPEAKKEEIIKLCEEAKRYGFASVCVNPTWVHTSAETLKGSNVNVCTVIGFPLGENTPESKAFEASNVIENGATEIDTVINIGALKDNNEELVERDIRAVVDAARGKALVKVIIEAWLLSEEEKVRACELSVKAGADYVKTSTGFSFYGATVEDVALMRKTVGPNIGVKASGGIKDYASLIAMVEAGASRIGSSRSVSLFEGKMI